MISIWWVRRDLRLFDNPALQAAIKYGDVLPLYILDPYLLERSSIKRRNFLFAGLKELNTQLKNIGSGLIICNGMPDLIFSHIQQGNRGVRVFAEEDYSSYARKRDIKVSGIVPLELIHGQTVIHPLLIHKQDGTPYTVFTPFSKNWKMNLPQDLEPIPAPDYLAPLPGLTGGMINENVLSSVYQVPLSDDPIFPAGEAEAIRRLDLFLKSKIYSYSDSRNRMDAAGTSSLSPYIRFGMISTRLLVYESMRAIRNAPDELSARSAEAWLNELIWREFYQAILYHFPGVLKKSFNPAFENIQWRDSNGEFEAWKAGMTGIPIVDAGMRQLSATGWMHNRARMITASFLVKDLLINWQWGEKWFMENLVDGDPASNNGGWQWAAGTGTDAAPYFRIFNPVLQSKKFDPDGNYIRKWIPELAHLPNEMIHTPWESGIVIPGYPGKPIVDHGLAKIRALEVYKLSKRREN